MTVRDSCSVATHTLPLPSASPSPPTPSHSPLPLPHHPHPPTPLCLSHTLPLTSASPSPLTPSHSPLPLPLHPHPPTPLCLSLTTHTLPLPSSSPSPPLSPFRSRYLHFVPTHTLHFTPSLALWNSACDLWDLHNITPITINNRPDIVNVEKVLRNNRVEDFQGDLGWDEQVDDEDKSGKDLAILITLPLLTRWSHLFFVEQANHHLILFSLSFTCSTPRPNGEASFSWLHLPLRFTLSRQRFWLDTRDIVAFARSLRRCCLVTSKTVGDSGVPVESTADTTTETEDERAVESEETGRVDEDDGGGCDAVSC
ncbi:hypothetical protein BLNAU_23587 [Blattamonas nauphoetae]|uniref:Uncharacterized protein n=1 Tax=Blattamonas nauphoetae TaxID=2049346 RepID=A0ABQ9WQX8_9EUKA|nr:hypothetical protein BLNAU_23587 [Blattamonas nauphoetae]